MEGVIHQRIESLGLQKLPLPLGTPSKDHHVPIFADADLKSKDRVVVIFGETVQDLGLLAGRIANGPGGLNMGSMVSVIHRLRRASSSTPPPGIILANMGQLFWWPEGGRPLTMAARASIPQSTLVHAGVKYVPSLHDIPHNETPEKHVAYMFGSVLRALLGETAKIDVIAISDSCDYVEKFLDDGENWRVWGGRLSSMVLLESCCVEEMLGNASFKEFLVKV